MLDRLLNSLRAATGRGRRAESARPRGRSGAARPIVWASWLTGIGGFSLLCLAATSAIAEQSPFKQITHLCGTEHAPFEEIHAQLVDTGWQEIERTKLDGVVEVLGDAFLLSGRLPADRQDLAFIRENQRSSMGSFVRRRNSDYFASASYAFGDNNEYVANIHWNNRNKRLDCRVASLVLDEPLEVRELVLQLTDNSVSNDLGLVRFTNSFAGQTDHRTSFFELNSSVLNSELDSRLNAHFGLSVISRR